MHAIASNHFKIISKINGVKGVFILDTGASSTFIDISLKDKFKLKSKTSLIEASGAGPNKLTTQLSKNNSIKIGSWRSEKFQILLIDLSNVNNAFASIKTQAVDGIIGADILKIGNGILDYEKRYLYLKY
tara:strand:+ start:427 stop:816 length:390 start_codon:yes stop_codon:yes gene_type:complete